MTHLPGQRAVQDGDEQGLRRVERGEEVGQQQRRSRQEHEARRPGDALQEEQRQGAHRPRPGGGGGGAKLERMSGRRTATCPVHKPCSAFNSSVKEKKKHQNLFFF